MKTTRRPRRWKEEKLPPGHYAIELTIRWNVDVEADDSWRSEDELLSDARRLGEMVDWEIQRP